MLSRIVISIIDLILGPIYGRKKFQSFFGLLHSMSLKGMNLRYNPIGDNGEKWLIEKIHIYFKHRHIVPVVFDVGANKGDYSISILAAFQHQVSLYSFEPSLKTFQELQKNLQNTRFSVSLCNIGMSDKITKAKLLFNTKDPATSSLYATESQQDTSVEEIDLTTIDDFCKLHLLTHIHFLKIDVEGNEVLVIKGAKQMIDSHGIDFIQFEFGPRNVASRTFFKDFFVLLYEKYSVYRILKNGLYSLNPYHQDYEAFFAGNYLAVNRRIKIQDIDKIN
jgi:FkbM family methyltransferase